MYFDRLPRFCWCQVSLMLLLGFPYTPDGLPRFKILQLSGIRPPLKLLERSTFKGLRHHLPLYPGTPDSIEERASGSADRASILWRTRTGRTMVLVTTAAFTGIRSIPSGYIDRTFFGSETLCSSFACIQDYGHPKVTGDVLLSYWVHSNTGRGTWHFFQL